MAIIQISKIQHRTGANVDLPQLSEGELGFATDEQKLYIGNDPLLHPPANNNTTTQVEILTEVSTLQHAKLDGSANTALNLSNTYPGQVMVLGADGNTWVNAGGNVLDAGNTAIIPDAGIHLGDAGNLKLTGGINGYVLQTDGQGNLSWTSAGIIQYTITNITKASPAVVTTSANNLITTGVPITISGVGGMTQLTTAGENGTNKFYAERIDNTTFSLFKDTAFTTPVDSTTFTTATYDANSLVTVSFYSQGTGSPGGANNQVQLNDGTGSFAGSANLTFSRITNQLTVGGNIVANVVTANVRGTFNGTVGATTPNTGAFTSITATTTAAITGNVNAGNTNIVGIANIGGNLNSANFRTSGTANVGNLNVVSNVTSNLLPSANVSFNIGSSIQSWKDVFVGNSISLNAQSITSDGTTATITGNLNVSNANLGNVATANYVTGTLTTNAQPNITSVGTLTGLTARGLVDLGNVGNLTIGGITANYVLTVKPDGSGLNWLPTQQVITNPGGVDTQVQFNDNSVFGGNARLTFNKVSGLLTTLSIAGEGGNLSNITGANVTGTVASATRAGTVTTNAQPNITSVGTLTSLAVTANANVGNIGTPGIVVAAGNITGANLNTTGVLSVTGNANVGNIGATIGVFTGNVSGLNASVSNLTLTNTLTVNANASIGNVSTGNITATSNISAGNLSTNGALSVNGNAAVGNLNVGAIVAVGQISTTDNLVVTGNITSGNISTGRGTFSGNVTSGNLSTSGSLTVSANTTISNLAISGNITGALLPSANVTYNLGSATQRWKDLYLSGTTIYLGPTSEISTDVNGALSINSNLTTTGNVTSGNVSTGNVTATGTATVTGNVVAGNVYANSGTVGATNLTGTLTTNAQPNITGVGRLANLTVGNSTVTSTFGNGTISSNSISVAGNILLTSTTPININGSTGTNGQVLSTTGTGVQWISLSPNSISSGTSNVNIPSSGSNVTVSVGGTSNVVTVSTTGVNVAGSLTATSLKLPGGTAGQPLVSDGAGGLIFGNGKAYAISTVNSLVAGSALVFDIDYSNTTYPAGVFTLRQLGPVTFSMSDTWSSGGTSKNAYTNGVTSTVNTRDITITLSLANATFAVNTSTDSIVVGSTVISGANLASLNIATNAGGTYSIPSSLFAAGAQTVNSPVTVSATLTTSRGQFNTSGTSLTNNQYVPFNISFNGSWASSSAPFFNVNQAFNWGSTVTGTVNSGNLRYTQVGNSLNTGSLTSSGATSGTSTSLDSSFAYTISTTDYIGIGSNVTSGTSTITASATVAAATKYYPLFYKITGSSANPNFITSDSYLTKAFALGDGANTSATASNYLWLAVPGSSVPRTFQHVDQGFTVVDTPDVTYTNQTIGGYTYQVFGFTNFSAALKIVVTS